MEIWIKKEKIRFAQLSAKREFSGHQYRTHPSYSPNGCCVQVSSKSDKRFKRESTETNPGKKTKTKNKQTNGSS